MKKMKLTEVRVKSFVSKTPEQQENLKGAGTGRACTPPTYFWYLCTDYPCQ